MTEHSDFLAEHIRSRMDELGLSPTDLANLTGLSLTALANIRRGERRAYQTRLTARVTAALSWTPDSIDRMLRDEPPQPIPVAKPGRVGNAYITDLIREATGGARPGKEGRISQFAKAIGTTSTTVGRWRDGVIPGPEWRAKLADYFETDEDEIELASKARRTGLEELDAKLDLLLSELREHRHVIEGAEGTVSAAAQLVAAVHALTERLDRRARPARTPVA